MDTDKSMWLKAIGQVCQAIAAQIRVLSGVDTDVMARHLDIVNLRRCQVDGAIPHVNGQAGRLRTLAVDALPHAAYRKLQAFGIHRLEKVIQCPGVERAHCVHAVGGDEDDMWHERFQVTHQVQATAIGQTDVQQGQVDISKPGPRKRGFEGGRFTDHEDIGLGRKKTHKPVARKRHVIDDQGTNHAASVPTGKRSVATKQVACRSVDNDAAAPWVRANRLLR